MLGGFKLSAKRAIGSSVVLCDTAVRKYGPKPPLHANSTDCCAALNDVFTTPYKAVIPFTAYIVTGAATLTITFMDLETAPHCVHVRVRFALPTTLNTGNAIVNCVLPLTGCDNAAASTLLLMILVLEEVSVNDA